MLYFYLYTYFIIGLNGYRQSFPNQSYPPYEHLHDLLFYIYNMSHRTLSGCNVWESRNTSFPRSLTPFKDCCGIKMFCTSCLIVEGAVPPGLIKNCPRSISAWVTQNFLPPRPLSDRLTSPFWKPNAIFISKSCRLRHHSLHFACALAGIIRHLFFHFHSIGLLNLVRLRCRNFCWRHRQQRHLCTPNKPGFHMLT